MVPLPNSKNGDFGLRLARRERPGNGAADEVGEFFARHLQVRFRRDGRAEVDFNFAKSADGMEPAIFSGNKLHIFEEDRNHRQTRFLGDIVEARLTRADAQAVAAGAFRKNDEVKLAGAAKFLELADASRVEFSALEEESNAAAENSL